MLPYIQLPDPSQLYFDSRRFINDQYRKPFGVEVGRCSEPLESIRNIVKSTLSRLFRRDVLSTLWCYHASQGACARLESPQDHTVSMITGARYAYASKEADVLPHRTILTLRCAEHYPKVQVEIGRQRHYCYPPTLFP
ncbi:unnamed protein product [Phytomonas sp. EM1]|nr:unnamed protein product [Phytomonas sp. EM1]|eukprot:CCW61350.1 unnamed protein product [Phytomonas sp. isolate EM1]